MNSDLWCYYAVSEEVTEAAPAEEPAPERQVSPDKLLRAALLRGRFADTILKAQEKTLPVNKVSPLYLQQRSLIVIDNKSL